MTPDVGAGADASTARPSTRAASTCRRWPRCPTRSRASHRWRRACRRGQPLLPASVVVDPRSPQAAAVGIALLLLGVGARVLHDPAAATASGPRASRADWAAGPRRAGARPPRSAAERSGRPEAQFCSGSSASATSPRWASQSSGSASGITTNFDAPDLDVLADHRAAARRGPTRSSAPARRRDGGAPPRRRPPRGSGPSRVGDQRAEVLRFDLPAAPRRRAPGWSTIPSRTSSGVQNDGQPAVAQAAAAPQLRGCDAPEPDVERLLEGERPHDRPLVVERVAVVVHDLPGPEPAEEREHLVEDLGPLPRSTPNAWCSPGSGAPSPNAGSSRPWLSRSRVASSLASSIGLRPGTTSTENPNLILVVSPAATPRPDDGIGTVPRDALGQPQRVEAMGLEPGDQRREPVRVARRPGAQPVADPHLHGGHRRFWG